MCGILLIAEHGESGCSSDGFTQGLDARGPDQRGELQLVTETQCHLHLAASLLQLRGNVASASPLVTASGNALCFNGELFGGASIPVGGNDGEWLLDALSVAADGQTDSDRGACHAVAELLSQLRGPWALIFWHQATSTLWFGRDVMGRRSLLVHWPDELDGRLILTSVSPLPQVVTPNLSTISASLDALGLQNGSTAVLSSPSSTTQSTASGKRPASGASTSPPNSVSSLPWLELTPGIHCIAFSALEVHASDVPRAEPQGEGTVWYSDHSSAPSQAGAQPVSVHEAGVGGSLTGQALASAADGSYAQDCDAVSETGVVSSVPSQCDEQQLQKQVAQHLRGAALSKHPWSDSLLTSLAQYSRPAELLLQQPMPEQPSRPKKLPTKKTLKPTSAQLHQTPPHPPQQLSSEPIHVDSASTPLPPQLSDPPPTNPHAAGQSAVHTAAVALLQCLQEAVAKRCCAIEGPGSSSFTNSPPTTQHPSTPHTHPAISPQSPLSIHRPSTTSFSLPSPPSQPTTSPYPVISRPNLHHSTSQTSTLSVPTTNEFLTHHSPDHELHPAHLPAAPPHSVTTGPVAHQPLVRHVMSSVRDLLPPAPVLLLFSGGVDSMLLAALMHRCLPPHLPIDLANICFDGGRSPDRIQGLAGLEELSRMSGPSRAWRFICVDSNLAEVDQHKPRLLRLLEPSTTVMDLNIGAALWLAASATGILKLPAYHQENSSSSSRPETSENSSPIATLSSWLCTNNSTRPPEPSTAATELQQPKELMQPPSQQVPARGPAAVTASHLEMLEAGSAGTDTLPEQAQQYRSCARVVLLGHGADEQCAGYGRHRTKYNSEGMAGLQSELALDVQRMWLRNLGRDDRLVADQSREARHPFLDEDVMSMLLSCPLEVVTDLRLPAGSGDKQVLRHALTLLGLPEAAGRPKRAIQFGSRIGKLSNCRDFGSNTAANARNAGSVQLTDIPKLQ